MDVLIEMRNGQTLQMRTVQLPLIGALLAGLVSGCGGDATAPSSSTNAQAFWALRLNQHAITMSVTPPYNTIQLTATALTPTGDTLAHTNAVQYRLLGDTSIAVGANGLITAKLPTYQTYDDNSYYGTPITAIVASLTLQGVTLADTALFLVTATGPAAPLATFSIQPPAESLSFYRSGKWLPSGLPSDGSASPSSTLPLRQQTAAGDVIDNLLVHVTSSNPDFAQASFFRCGLCVYGIKGGTSVVFYAQTWYYGVARQDSLLVGIGYPTSAPIVAYARTPYASLTPELYWGPSSVDLTAPAKVSFANDSYTQRIDVIFDDPADVQEDTARKRTFEGRLGFGVPIFGSGNIAPFFHDTAGAGVACSEALYDGTTRAADSACTWGNQSRRRLRLFTKPGTYTYHTLFGNGGKIVIH